MCSVQYSFYNKSESTNYSPALLMYFSVSDLTELCRTVLLSSRRSLPSFPAPFTSSRISLVRTGVLSLSKVSTWILSVTFLSLCVKWSSAARSSFWMTNELVKQGRYGGALARGMAADSTRVRKTGRSTESQVLLPKPLLSRCVKDCES